MIFWFSARHGSHWLDAAAEEAVEVVEAPAVRPPVERAGRALLPVGRQVPLAERRRAVAVVPQDPRQRRAVPGQGRRVAGEPAGELADRAEADRVAVPPGQQRRPRRRAQRGDVEPVVPQPAARRSACSSASGSARRTCSGCRTRRRRSAPAARSARPSGGVGCPIRFQSGCEPSSVRLATPANVPRRIGRLVRSGSLTSSRPHSACQRGPVGRGPQRTERRCHVLPGASSLARVVVRPCSLSRDGRDPPQRVTVWTGRAAVAVRSGGAGDSPKLWRRLQHLRR